MNIATIFAGGIGARMHSKDKPKQFLEMHNKPIIVHTLEHFQNHGLIDAIVVVCIQEWMEHCKKLIEKYQLEKVKSIVPGGASGQLSIYNGLMEAKRICGKERSIVLIHDGVRPLINSKVITDNINSVLQHGSAITTANVKETILVVDENHASIDYVPNRRCSRIAKGPQSFWLDEVLDIEKKSLEDGITDWVDTCTMMQNYGKQMYLIDGPDENIKITTPEDFYMMRALLDAKENAQIYGF